MAEAPSRTPPQTGAGAFLRILRLLVGVLPEAVGWVLALFTLLNVLGDFVRPGFDANYTWMPLDLYGLWPRFFMGLFGLLLLWSLLKPPSAPWRYVATQALLLFLCSECLRQTWNFYDALAHRRAHTWLPLPFALFALVALALQVWRVRKTAPRATAPGPGPTPARVVAVAGVGLVVWELFLIGQMFLVGTISWPRPADCIIVMGAAVTADGEASVALMDRTRQGVWLYRRGLAPRIIMSGGPAEPCGPTEPQVMAALALHWKVPPHAVLRDELGHSTFDTVNSCRKLMRANGWRRAIVVSHDYHLSRTALAFYRARLPVTTDPAPRARIQSVDFYNVFRESLAWTYYYFRPFWQPYDPA